MIVFSHLSSRRNSPQKGSATLLSVSIILPLICVVVIVGVELAGYFAVSNRNQEFADTAARIAARIGGSGEQSVEVARRYLAGSVPNAEQARIEVRSLPSSAEVIIEQPLYLPFLGLLRGLSGQDSSAMIPAVVRSEVKRFPFRTEVILDVKLDGSNLCGEPLAQKARSLADELGYQLFRSSGLVPSLGVQPGRDRNVDSLSDGLCSSPGSSECPSERWIPSELVCDDAFLEYRPYSSAKLQGYLRHELDLESALARDTAHSSTTSKSVFRVSWSTSSEGTDSGLELLDYEVNELAQFLSARNGRLDILDIEIRSNLAPELSESIVLERRGSWGSIRKISISDSTDVIELAGRLASLRRREVIAR